MTRCEIVLEDEHNGFRLVQALCGVTVLCPVFVILLSSDWFPRIDCGLLLL
jgi:hypothetical protein